MFYKHTLKKVCLEISVIVSERVSLFFFTIRVVVFKFSVIYKMKLKKKAIMLPHRLRQICDTSFTY